MTTPIILLHGAIGSKTQLSSLKEALSPKHSVYDLDFSGHGGRPVPEQLSIPDFADEITEQVAALGFSQVDIFGYSMGGYVALFLARYRLEIVRRIVTLGTKLHWDPLTAEKEMRMLDPEKIKEKVPQFAEALAKRHGTDNWEPLLERTATLLHGLGNGQALRESDFRQIQQRTLILLGDADNMVTREESELIAGLLPNGNFQLLEGAKHPIEQVPVGALVTAIQDFLHA